MLLVTTLWADLVGELTLLCHLRDQAHLTTIRWILQFLRTCIHWVWGHWECQGELTWVKVIIVLLRGLGLGSLHFSLFLKYYCPEVYVYAAIFQTSSYGVFNTDRQL